MAANHFWESLGFVPLAFRVGSEKKRRVHIFWQKRIVEGDAGGANWWYPSKTGGGAMAAERLVFPIPPGVCWRDVEAVQLPANPKSEIRNPKQIQSPKSKIQNQTAGPVKHGPRQFGPPPAVIPAAQTVQPVVAQDKSKREKAPKAKIDPGLVAKSRELRDRWMERLNAGETMLESVGKYHVARALPGAPASLKALPQAA